MNGQSVNFVPPHRGIFSEVSPILSEVEGIRSAGDGYLPGEFLRPCGGRPLDGSRRAGSSPPLQGEVDCVDDEALPGARPRDVRGMYRGVERDGVDCSDEAVRNERMNRLRKGCDLNRSETVECLRGVSGEVSEFLSEVMELQCFLGKFKDARIWSAFVNGEMCVKPSVGLVKSFELVMSMIIPSSRSQLRDGQSADFLTKVILEELGTPQNVGGMGNSDEFTFKEWRYFFRLLQNSRFWTLEETKTRKEKFEINSGPKIGGQGWMNMPEYEKYYSHSEELRGNRSSSGVRDVPNNERECGGRRCDTLKRDISPLSPIRRREDSHVERSLLELFKNLGRTRDVVRPEIYDGSGAESFREFLSEYEQYFHQKFEGGERQKAKLLGEFLAGEMRDFYNAIGGNRMPYSELKVKLAGWHRQRKCDRFEILEERFDRMGMQENETFHIFAMRIERLGQELFTNERERERQLLKKFRKTVPRGFARVLSTHERDMFAAGSDLTWTYVKNLAVAQDRHSREQRDERVDYDRDVWLSAPVVERYENSEWKKAPIEEAKRWNYGRRQPFGERREVPRCHYCGKIGHIASSCWLKLGWCDLCGNREHRREDCPRFKREGNFTPICSECGGPHLGRDCDGSTGNSKALNQRGQIQSSA